MARKKTRNRTAKVVKPEKRPRRGLLWGGIGVGALVFGGALLYVFYIGRHSGSFDFAQDRPLSQEEGKTGMIPIGGQLKTDVPVTAQYVGSNTCFSCHGKEASEWQISQHHDAMAEASEQSVRGDFSNAKFNYAGITSTFFKRDGKFFVNTDGRDGKLSGLRNQVHVRVYPLQQYLIEFADGRLSALSIAWDARPKGRRPALVSSVPNERIAQRRAALDPAGAKLEFDVRRLPFHRSCGKITMPAADRFRTHWAEINVGCEACHGPGSRHLEWGKANRQRRGRRQ